MKRASDRGALPHLWLKQIKPEGRADERLWNAFEGGVGGSPGVIADPVERTRDTPRFPLPGMVKKLEFRPERQPPGVHK